MVIIRSHNRALTAARGFTLVELLVVISILGVLAAVVILNVTRFVHAGAPEAYAVEHKQVHTAAACYLIDGNNIVSATTVGPGNSGIIAPWVKGNLKYNWTINTDGSVDPVLFYSALSSLDGLTPLSGTWTPGPGGLSTGGDAGSLLATGGNWSDFTFQTTATFSPTDAYGLYYRSDGSAGNGYVLQYDPTSGTLVVRTIVDGVESAALASVNMPSGFSGQHSISISVGGSGHSVSVDGASVMSFSDSTYSSGTVGLQSAAGSNVSFTGFTVSPP